MPPRKNAAASKASTATPYVSSVVIILSGMLDYRVFRRPKPRAPTKKVVKSSEFIYDEAAEL